ANGDVRKRVGRRQPPSVSVSEVCDQVDSWDDRQSSLGEACKTPWKVPRMTVIRVPVETLESAALDLEQLVIGEQFPDSLSHGLIRPCLHVDVVMAPCPTPGGPAPHTSEVREMIALSVVSPSFEVVATAHHHHLGVVAVVVEHD